MVGAPQFGHGGPGSFQYDGLSWGRFSTFLPLLLRRLALADRHLRAALLTRIGQNAHPKPILVLHLNKGKVVNSCDLTTAPEWTKPILLAALKASK
jgi:hypothetical protein